MLEAIDYRPLWRADVFALFEKNDLDRHADGNRGCARGKKTKRSLMARNTRYGRKLPGVTVICAFFFLHFPSLLRIVMIRLFSYIILVQ